MSAFERLIELTIRAGSWEPRVDGTPVKTIGWPEVAAAMAFVPTESADLLRAVYLHDGPSAWKVHRRLMQALDRWPDATNKPSTLFRERLIDAVVGAFVMLRPCRMCGGAGELRIPARSVMDGETGEWKRLKAYRTQCTTCTGDGFDHVKASAVQLALGVDAETWETLHAPFDFAYAMLIGWHEQGKAGITARLNREE